MSLPLSSFYFFFANDCSEQVACVLKSHSPGKIKGLSFARIFI